MVESRPPTLSARQRECLKLVGRGLTSKAIAAATGLSASTVDGHIRTAMLKLGTGSRRAAALMATQAEVDPAPDPALAGLPPIAAAGAARAADRRRPAERAAALLRAGAARQAAFPAPIFAEPSWDVLLALYVASAAGQDLPLSAIGNRAGVAPTTALRAVALLEQGGWARRGSVGETTTVAITERAAAGLEAWLAASFDDLSG